MQAMADPARPHVRDLADLRHVPSRVRDRVHRLGLDAIEDPHEDGPARLPPSQTIAAEISSPTTGSASGYPAQTPSAPTRTARLVQPSTRA